MKINTANIQGYADMSAEEKVAYFESLEINDFADELERAKSSVSKANSEAADYKRKLKEATAAKDQISADAENELASIKKQLAALQREKAISENKASFLAQGYSEALALDSATALIDGDNVKLFANMNTFISERDKSIQAQNVGNMKRPGTGVGNPDTTVDYQNQIANALESDDYSTAAYYMALQQEGGGNH